MSPVQQIRGTDVLDSTIRNIDLGSDTARLNLLTNGGFEIWQRGAGGFVASGSGVWTADRWQTTVLGSSTATVTRTASLAGNDPAGLYYATMAYTHVGGGVGYLSQSLDNYQAMVGRTLTFSMFVKSTVDNNVRLYIYDTVNARRYSGYYNGGGVWQRLTVTAPIASNAGTPMSVGIEATVTQTMGFDDAMLVVGSVAADYAPLHPADDLARCLRYYQRWQPGNGGEAGLGQSYSTQNAIVPFPLSARLAVTPTVTVSAASDWALLSPAAAQQTCTALTYRSGGLSGSVLSLNANVAANLVVGNATLLVGANANAWVAAESNP